MYFLRTVHTIFRLLLMLLICFVSSQLKAQKATADELKQFSQLLGDIRSAMDTSTENAFKLVSQLRRESRRLGIDSLIAKAYTEEGYCNYYAGQYGRAAECFDSAGLKWKNTDQLSYARSLNNRGSAFMYHSEYYQSLQSFVEALDIFRKLKNDKLTAGTLANIGLVYESLGDWDNALLYDKQGLELKTATHDSAGMANGYGNVGNIYMYKEMADSAIYFQRLSLIINQALENPAGISNALGNLGNAFRLKKMPDSSVRYLQEAIAISARLGNAENHANFLDNMAESYMDKDDYASAFRYAQQAALYEKQITDNEFLQEHYSLMYRYYKKMNNLPQAFGYLEKLQAVSDSIFREKINIQNQKLTVEYEYKQKNLQDRLNFQTQLTASEQTAAALRTRFLIAVLLVLLLAALAVTWYLRSKWLEKKHLAARQETELQQQKIMQLEKEKQLLASQALLTGQEEERSRMARDLHDGLGGLLTGVKHSIVHMKDTFILSGEQVTAFEKSLGMIDTSMKELRRIAHNMMPEALARFGLEEAIKDYCASVSTAGTKVLFQDYGPAQVLPATVNVIVYRIIQELVNNSLKHARAAGIDVQLVRGPDWVTLTVEDDGAGFDSTGLVKNTGAGWTNIRSRVDYLGGNIDLNSVPGKGTSVSIELKIANV